jgi:transmembrane sensor
MNISREQYHRFLTNQCSEEERLLFTGYLEQHPEVLEQLLQPEDWEQFSSDLHLHPAFSAIMRHRFTDYLQQQQQQRKKWYRASVAVAAAVLVLGASLWWLLPGPAKPAPVAAKQSVADTAAMSWQVAINETDTAIKIILEDRSVVKLYGHSILRYKKVMDRTKRELFLTGTADFSVAKDAQRPFTVYAGGVATTALGTYFKVIAKAGKKEVKVKLYKGRVVVKAAGSKAAPVFLFPGDKLAMNTAGDYRLHAANAEVPPPGIVKKNHPVPYGDAFAFDHTPLAEVLEQLKKRFNTPVQYDPSAIRSIYITATFTQQDTLSGILTILCNLNDLQLKSTDTVFTISR